MQVYEIIEDDIYKRFTRVWIIDRFTDGLEHYFVKFNCTKGAYIAEMSKYAEAPAYFKREGFSSYDD